ncbi:right-handed parallel beta-helix repeat-containing protein [Bacillus phage PK1]|nr:right-handed parallel beta-helix repeat-containing protein [Bacillus phage PK1]
MAEYTQNYNLYKPSRNDTDPIDTTLTTNFQTIDEEIKKRETDIANLNTNFESKTTELDSKIDSESLNLKEQIDTKTTMLQNQVDGLVVNGDSSPAIAQALAGTPYATLKEKHDAVDANVGNLKKITINVADYGAVADWNGTTGTDNTAAFASAIDACSPGGKIVFPKGDYVGKLDITKPIHIDFQGSKIIPPSTSVPYIIQAFGIESSVKYVLSAPLVRRQRSFTLTSAPTDISAGDLIVIRDDSVRPNDGKANINMEVHEVLSVSSSTITLKDFIRLPKKVSLTSNVYKITPIKGVKLENINIEALTGASGNWGIFFDMCRDVEVNKFNMTNNAGPAFTARRSYNVSVDGFNISKPQSTSSGQGYGVQVGEGTNVFTFRNGHGDGLRHLVDLANSFDGLVDNVVAVNNASAAFVPSHNGFDADITFRKCRSYGGTDYHWSLNSQGVSDPYSLVFYGFSFLDCESVADLKSGLFICFYCLSPIQESRIDGFKITYGDGSVIPTTSASAIRLHPVNNDITVNNVEINGFKYGIFQDGSRYTVWASNFAYTVGYYIRPSVSNGKIYKCTTAGTSGSTEPIWPTTPGGTVTDGTIVWQEAGAETQFDQTDDSKRVVFRDLTLNNCDYLIYSRFAHNLHFERLSLNNVTGATSAVFYLYWSNIGQQLRHLTIKDVFVSGCPISKFMYFSGFAVSGGLFGKIDNIQHKNASPSATTITSGQNLTINDILTNKNGDVVKISSTAAITVGTEFLPRGIVEGKIVTIMNVGSFDITIPQGANFMTNNSGGNLVLGATKRSATWMWSDSKWVQVS